MFKTYHAVGFMFVFLFVGGTFLQLGLGSLGGVSLVASALMACIALIKHLNG